MRRILGWFFGFVAIAILGGADGCVSPSADRMEAKQTQRMQQEASRRVGMPGVTNFLEKRWVAKLYEMRDSEVATYTYVADMHGDLHHVCDSIGFGIPASVQFSNPQKEVRTNYPMPQAEPNGLFMPEGLSATYVLCAAESGEPHPIYSEPQLIVSPFRLAAVSSWMASPPADQMLRKRAQ